MPQHPGDSGMQLLRTLPLRDKFAWPGLHCCSLRPVQAEPLFAIVDGFRAAAALLFAAQLALPADAHGICSTRGFHKSYTGKPPLCKSCAAATHGLEKPFLQAVLE